MPLPTPQRKKQIPSEHLSNASLLQQDANGTSLGHPSAARASKLPSPTRSPTRSGQAPTREVDAERRRSLLPQWKRDFISNVTLEQPGDVPASSEDEQHPPATNPALRLRKLDRKLDSDAQKDGKRAAIDTVDNLEPGIQNQSNVSKSKSVPVPQSLARSQSLRKPAIHASRTKSTLQSTVSGQAPGFTDLTTQQGTTSGTLQYQDSSRLVTEPVTSAKAGNNVRRTTSSAASHKRTQSTSSQPKNHANPVNSSHKRSTSNVPRNLGQFVTNLGAGQVATSAVRTKDARATTESKLQRPAFSTFQQQFSPKKVANASQVASNTAASDDVSASQHQNLAEDFRLQTELLQLQILHERSIEALKSWEASAGKSLRQKFEKVVHRHGKMIEDEILAQSGFNQAALQEWTEAGMAVAVEDNIQCLSKLLQENLSLTASGGRYTRLHEGFDRWFAMSVDMFQDSALSFCECLDEHWRSEHASLTRKLTDLSREADHLPDQRNDSSIATITWACKDLIKGMLDELRLMLVVESEVSRKEQTRIDKELAHIEHDIEIASQDLGRIWGTDV
ncbi:MAG: hypothetical protein M1822_003779 [Bathelium mastoideum]|nr:MAG: hypothetical protein M1822_003779 [Bathelium mastoideum]